MKNIFAATLIFALPLFANALNPMQHMCTVKGGIVVDVNVPGDQVMMCDFSGAGLGGESVLSGSSAAINAYLSNSSVSSCGAVGAKEVDGTVVGTSDSYSICQFGDGSRIELSVLQSGVSSSTNAGLNQALGVN